MFENLTVTDFDRLRAFGKAGLPPLCRWLLVSPFVVSLMFLVIIALFAYNVVFVILRH